LFITEGRREILANQELENSLIYKSDISSDQMISISNITNNSICLNQDDLHVNNMEMIHQGITRFLFIIQTSSVIDSLIDVINSIKNIGFGIIWKAILKVFPPISVVDSSISNIQSSLQGLTLPMSTLHKILPGVITSMKQSNNSNMRLSGFSGQLYSVTSLLPEIQKQLNRLNGVVNTVYNAMSGFDSALEKLKSIKGIGQLSSKLQGAFVKGIDYFGKMKSSNEELNTAIDKTMVWLPEYQKSIRQIISSSTLCQVTVSKGFFKKELCRKSVTWFDDEAEAVCNKCGLHLCEQHRIADPLPAGSSIRNIWYCLDCIKRIK